jgi:RND family efflux transporter MFP subunit
MAVVLRRAVVPRLAKAVARLVAAAVLAFTAASSANAAEFTVSLQAIPDLKAVYGTVESLHLTPARSRNGGTVDQLAVQEGDRVAIGQRLALVTDPKLPLQLAALDARIRALLSQQAQARIDLDRMQQLIKTGSVTRASLDAADTNAAVVAANLAAMQAERAVVAEQIAEGDVLAPASGRILKVQVVNGQVVLPGEPIAMIAADAYVLRMRLPERHAKFIRVGDKVLVGARGLDISPEALIEGRVRLVYPEIDQGEVVADVDVANLGDYFVGERTRVFVSTGTRQAIVVPESYVYKRFGIAFARLKGIGETVIQPGLPAEGGIEVLSGLKPGDVLLPPEASP